MQYHHITRVHNGRLESGFSLIELLVTLGIIALLVGILLPTLGAVRRVAQKAVCGSNLQQISTAVLAYEQTEKSMPGPVGSAVVVPWTYTERRVSPEYNLPFRLRGYIDDGWPVDGAGGASPAYDEGTIPDYWQCPSNEAARDTSSGIEYLYRLNNGENSNPKYIFGSIRGTGNRLLESVFAPKSVDDMVAVSGGKPAASLSSIWLLADIDGGNYNQNNDLVNVGAAHQGGNSRNHVYADGHVTAVKTDESP